VGDPVRDLAGKVQPEPAGAQAVSADQLSAKCGVLSV